MKCMIAFACLLAVASAGYINNAVVYGAEDDGSYKGEFYNGNVGSYYAGALGYAAYGNPALAYSGYAGPLARAVSPIAYSAPKSFGYQSATVHPYGYTGYGYTQASPLAYGYANAAPIASEARLVDPVAIAAGAPLPTGDTVEVAAAKAVHFQAHAAAKGVAYSAYSPALAYSGYAAPIAHAVAPVAHGFGYAHSSPLAYGYAHAAPLALASEARLIDPVAIAAGAPLPTGDTVEVAAAKAFHHQAHVEAKTGHLLAKSGHFITKRSPGYLNTAYTTPLAHAAAPAYGYSHGVSAYASPLAYSGYTGYTGYGYGGHLGAYYG